MAKICHHFLQDITSNSKNFGNMQNIFRVNLEPLMCSKYIKTLRCFVSDKSYIVYYIIFIDMVIKMLTLSMVFNKKEI